MIEDPVFPGIIVGPLTEKHLRKLHEIETGLIGYPSADKVKESQLNRVYIHL